MWPSLVSTTSPLRGTCPYPLARFAVPWPRWALRQHRCSSPASGARQSPHRDTTGCPHSSSFGNPRIRPFAHAAALLVARGACRCPERCNLVALNNAWLINQTVEVVVSSSPHFEQCYEGGGVSPSAGQAAAGWRGGRTSLTVSAGLPGRNCAWRSSPGWNAPITANVVNAPSAGSPRSSLRQFNRLPPRPENHQPQEPTPKPGQFRTRPPLNPVRFKSHAVVARGTEP